MPTIALPALKMCKHCPEIATASDGCCINHTRSPRRIRNYSSSPKVTRSMKNPVGVELECKNANRDKLTTVGHVSADGSVTGGGEIKLVADASKIGIKAADIAQRARIAGAYVDRDCGFHVHLSSIRNHFGFVSLNYEEHYLQRLFKVAQKIENFIFDLMPQSRQRNLYCRRLTDHHSIGYHHSWISASSRVPTIEIRIHPGTLNPWKVKGWIEACIVMQKAFHAALKEEENQILELFMTGEHDRILEAFGYDTLAYRYVSARLASGGKLRKFGFNQ